MLEVKGQGLTIGEVARAAGVAKSAIRYYESVGILPPAPRKNGIRRYAPEIVDRLKVIRFCRTAGMPVRSLTWMSDDTSVSRGDGWTRAVRKRIDDLDAAMREAKRMRRLLLAAEACRCRETDDDCVVLKAAAV